jgi:uncharacterized protein YkwD
MTQTTAWRPQPMPAPARLPRAASRRLGLLAAFAFVASSVGLLVTPGSTLAWDANTFNSTSEQQLVALTNQARASAGLRTLKVDSTLTSIARSRSKDMIVRNYFSHNIPPSGNQVFSILDSKGYCYSLAGENIGWNTYSDDSATAQIQQMFMGSPSHRSNIMNKRWDAIGIGAYKGPSGKKMWTVLFADRCGSTAPAPKPKPVPKPVARPVAKPAPKSTPKPAATPALTPTPTPTPTPTQGPPDPLARNGGSGPDATAIPLVGNGSAGGDHGAALRVVDPSSPPGLVDSIVGDVTVFFLGA